MTSASELFHSRRHRFGHRHNAIDALGFDSSLPDANSSSSSHQHRSTTNRRHNHHYSSQNNRREHRHDLDVCERASRRIHRRRLDHSEHEPVVQPDQGRSQSPSGSIINSDDFRSIQRRRATGNNDRLPGSVLLARERLVERLRGVSVSGNRYILTMREVQEKTLKKEKTEEHPRSHPFGRQTESRTLMHQIPSELRSSDTSGGSSSSSQQDRFIGSENILLEEMRRRKHRGEDGLKLLELEVFGFKNDDERSNSRECTICLEGFEDGDDVIRLKCAHIFHSGCLFPWVRVCGSCPNCRKTILIK